MIESEFVNPFHIIRRKLRYIYLGIVSDQVKQQQNFSFSLKSFLFSKFSLFSSSFPILHCFTFHGIRATINGFYSELQFFNNFFSRFSHKFFGKSFIASLVKYVEHDDRETRFHQLYRLEASNRCDS